MEHTYFFAVDLGATSGRTILGCLGEGKMELKELTRFPNHIIETGGHCYWDIYALYNEIIKGLKVVAKDNLLSSLSVLISLGGGFRISGQRWRVTPQSLLLSRPSHNRCTRRIFYPYSP